MRSNIRHYQYIYLINIFRRCILLEVNLFNIFKRLSNLRWIMRFVILCILCFLYKSLISCQKTEKCLDFLNIIIISLYIRYINMDTMLLFFFFFLLCMYIFFITWSITNKKKHFRSEQSKEDFGTQVKRTQYDIL